MPESRLSIMQGHIVGKTELVGHYRR